MQPPACSPLQPPVPEKRPVQITQLAAIRTDNYQWMKDDNWQKVLEDPSLLKQDIAQYLHAENAYHEATLSCTDDLKEAMFLEMKGRTKEDSSSPPYRDGLFEYYYRFEVGAEHGIHARKSVESAVEEILLDEDAASKGKSFYEVHCTDHSPDHTHFGWCKPPPHTPFPAPQAPQTLTAFRCVDEIGSEKQILYIKCIGSNELVGEPIDNCFSFEWSPCSQYVSVMCDTRRVTRAM